MDFFILVGIIGKELDSRFKDYSVDYVRVRNLEDGFEYNLTMDYIKDNDVKVLGLDGTEGVNGNFVYSLKSGVLTLPNNSNFYRCGVLPVYNSLEDAENPKKGYIKVGDWFYIFYCRYLYEPSYTISVAISLDANDTSVIFSEEYFNLSSSSGYAIDCKYSLNMNSEECGEFGDYLEKKGLIKVTGKNDDMVKIDLDCLSLFSPSDGGTHMLDSNCRYLGIKVDTDSDKTINLVVNPDIKVASILKYGCYSFSDCEFKMFISRKVDTNFIVNLAFWVTFDCCGDEFIGFECFIDEDEYPGKLDKCKEITERLNSRDTSDRLYSDIDCLVKNLNEIGFNIELY